MIRSILILASWRLRRTWGLLLLMSLGMVAAVALVCLVPLYSEVVMTAGLRDTINAAGANADAFVQGTSNDISASVIDRTSQNINHEFKRRLGSYIGSQQFFVTTTTYPRDVPAPGSTKPILIPNANGTLVPYSPVPFGANSLMQETFDKIRFVGVPIQQAQSHIMLVQGRMPGAITQGKNSVYNLEIAISTYSAKIMHAHLGMVIQADLALNPALNYIGPLDVILNLHIVGIFKLPQSNVSYFHGENFLSVRVAPLAPGEIYPVMVSSTVFTNQLSQIIAQQKVLTFESPMTFIWYYKLHSEQININNLGNVVGDFNAIQSDAVNKFAIDDGPYLQQSAIGLPFDLLQQYSSQSEAAEIVVASLLALVVGLVLFFMSMMTNLLVDRQIDAIALLRSRGASRRQIVGALMLQSLALALAALIIGPLLASVAAQLLVTGMLPLADQGAKSILPTGAIQTGLSVIGYAVAAAIVVSLTLFLSVFRATRLDMLALRRQTARSSYTVLWKRWNLDIAAAVIMIFCYGMSVYVTSNGLNNGQLQLLLLSPLSLVGSICLMLAGILIFLRFFPRLLQFGNSIATRGRGASPILALAQLARTPRYAIRMTLLLALATAMVIFTLIFTASQAQRVQDVAAFQAGADFSGSFNPTYAPMAQLTALYRNIPGASAASVGYSTTQYAKASGTEFPVDSLAIDPATFSQTSFWTSQDSTQSLSSLMAQLAAGQSIAKAHNLVPAIVDASTAQALHLSAGEQFTLTMDISGFEPLHFVTIAIIQHIPTISDSADSLNTGSALTSGGILVNYQSFADVVANVYTGQSTPLNYAWVDAYNNASSVASVRYGLTNMLPLQGLNDRRATIASLSSEPLYLDLGGILAVGTLLALILALLGNVIASWMSASSRLTNFAVLRALGGSRRQLARILTLEQGIIYCAALGLGILFGAILAKLALPTLIFTSVSSNGSGTAISTGQFYIMQNVPPVQVVIPASLEIALALLIVICAVAIGTMVRIVSRPSLGQTLRINED
jgi:putative ABC transport system permease protein